MEGLQTWVINLDRSPDRLASIREQAQRVGLPLTRLRAVDARDLTPAQRACLDEAAFRRLHGMPPLAAELACYLSHLEAVRAFLASHARFALVLEDDVRLQDTLPAVLQALMRHHDRWDVVKLSAVHRGTPQPVLELVPGHWLAVMLSRVTGSSAYLINRRAAEAYLHPTRGLLPMRLPYDHVQDRGWALDLKVRLVTPTPCCHDDQVPSTIGAPNQGAPSRKFHWTKRLAAYRYRLGNELQRLAYGLRETLREKRQR